MERARAARWLTAVRVALHAEGASSQEVTTLDITLDVLYRAAARDVPDPDRLRLITIRPPDGQAQALRDALDPVAANVGGQAQPFTDQAEDFQVALRETYGQAIREFTRTLVVGRRMEDRVPANLYTMEHMGRIAALARERIEKVSGHLVTVPVLDYDRPGSRRNIHDLWADEDQQIRTMTEAEQRDLARQELIKYLSWSKALAGVLREHHAVPIFDADRAPPNWMSHPGERRYASIADVMRLLHVVGDVRNLYAAFFLGDVEKITGPISLAAMGSPRAPVSAGDVAALVARLNALPAADVDIFYASPRQWRAYGCVNPWARQANWAAWRPSPNCSTFCCSAMREARVRHPFRPVCAPSVRGPTGSSY